MNGYILQYSQFGIFISFTYFHDMQCESFGTILQSHIAACANAYAYVELSFCFSQKKQVFHRKTTDLFIVFF